MPTPRCFIIRHGETEWSLNGRHTGTSDVPLTSNGERRIRATGKALVGDDRLIVPSRLCHIYVSPRHRAQRTLELLSLGCQDRLPWIPSSNDEEANAAAEKKNPSPYSIPLQASTKVQVTEDIREWDYGEYEGLTSPHIRQLRKEKGLSENWDIWRDGCPGGESPDQITARLDNLITNIRTRFHAAALEDKSKSQSSHSQKHSGDILIVAHGHILRAFAMRWIGRGLTSGVSLLLEAGGVGTLSYEHGNIEEPAILLGGAFMVDVVENAAEEKK